MLFESSICHTYYFHIKKFVFHLPYIFFSIDINKFVSYQITVVTKEGD